MPANITADEPNGIVEATLLRIRLAELQEIVGDGERAASECSDAVWRLALGMQDRGAEIIIKGQNTTMTHAGITAQTDDGLEAVFHAWLRAAVEHYGLTA
ncbi:MAG: hypothetical protein AAGG09_06445 [Pseudomonadota bacterium]